MNVSRVPRPKVTPKRRKRCVEDGLLLGELIVLRALDRGETQAQISVSCQYSRGGIAAMLARLRALYDVTSTRALLRDPRVREALDGNRAGGGS